MKSTLRKLIWLLPAWALAAVVWLGAVEAQPESPAEATRTNSTERLPLVPGPNDGRIAYVVARMLEQGHYLRHPLDDEFSGKFLDRYLEALDPQHLHFTEKDLAEFEHYREQLDDLTLKGKRVPGAPPAGDTSPAYEIFTRFFLRLTQRVAYMEELLRNEIFEFTTDERMLANRREAPYPKDLNEAKQLWRQRLRYEYLQEKLARHGAKDKPGLTTTDSRPDALPQTNTLTVTGGGTNSAAAKTVEPVKEVKKKTDAEEIADTLKHRYARNLRLFKEWDSEDVLQVYLTALARIYDPHSDYFNKVQADNFAIGMNNSLFGIGAVLTTDADGYCKIQELKPGPATNSKKLKAGDRIVAVAQSNAPPVDVIEMALNKVVQMIRGPKGTEVRLTIQPANKDAADRFVVNLVREEIKLEDQAAKARIFEMPNGTETPLRLGVIDLPSFYAPVDFSRDQNPLLTEAGTPVYGRYPAVDVAAILKKFNAENVAGVILDLRRNGGGSLEEAIKVAGLFIKEGPVVQVRLSDGRKFVRDDPDPSVAYEGPLIVLTSRFSASASEIVAGALQDYGRALVVGDISTHGKGTVQNLNPLRPYVEPATVTATNDPGQLKVTIQKFYRVSGASTQLKGVMPDIVLPSVLNHSPDIGEDAHENPLKWDTIQGAKFEKLNLVEPCLAELLKRSNDRVVKDKDFEYVREDIERFRKNQADKTISLNEQERLKEKDEADARQKERDRERLARKEPDRKVYELALKQLDLPGLPPPVEKTNTLAKTSATRNGAGGISTNSAAVAATPSPGDDTADEDEEDEKPPAVDATLEETEHILADYVSLLSQKHLLTVGR